MLFYQRQFFIYMKFVIFAALAVATLAACNAGTTETAPGSSDSLVNSGISDIVLNSNYDVQKLTGLYQGMFDGSPISISINYISGKNVSGYNVHKGLKRNIRGSLEPFGTMFKFMLDEPGSNKYDGHFEFTIDTSTFKGRGSWQPKNDSSLGKKAFDLARIKTEGNNDLVNTWSDSTGRMLDLKADGSATFTWYTGADKSKEQMQSFSGNWIQAKDSVIITWQPNDVFPSRRTALFVFRNKYEGDETLYIEALRGKEVEFTSMMP